MVIGCLYRNVTLGNIYGVCGVQDVKATRMYPISFLIALFLHQKYCHLVCNITLMSSTWLQIATDLCNVITPVQRDVVTLYHDYINVIYRNLCDT